MLVIKKGSVHHPQLELARAAGEVHHHIRRVGKSIRVILLEIHHHHEIGSTQRQHRDGRLGKDHAQASEEEPDRAGQKPESASTRRLRDWRGGGMSGALGHIFEEVSHSGINFRSNQVRSSGLQSAIECIEVPI